MTVQQKIAKIIQSIQKAIDFNNKKIIARPKLRSYKNALQVAELLIVAVAECQNENHIDCLIERDYDYVKFCRAHDSDTEFLAMSGKQIICRLTK